MQFFAACPKGLEELLATELAALGAGEVKQTVAGVHFEGELATAYRACLWSRLASRILLPLLKIEEISADRLYEAVHALAWEEQVAANGTIAVDAHGTNDSLRNTQFTQQRVKDAIVDRLRDVSGERPNIDTWTPDLRVHVLVRGTMAQISLDLSGGPLHQRGYRRNTGIAPLKENLAAAMLLRAGWPEIAANGGALVDPMCGSGTLLIEGALIAADVAPGLLRTHYGFLRWRGHQPQLWQSLLDEAEQRAAGGRKQDKARYFGSDRDGTVLAAAKQNAQQAGISGFLSLHHHEVDKTHRPEGFSSGLVITNPPYGERLEDNRAAAPAYVTFGELLKREFGGWRAALITSDESLAHAVGLKADKRYALFNGALACTLYRFEVFAARPEPREAPPLSEAAQGVRNRIDKNLKHLRPKLKREGIECFRAYDADLPDYAAAIDVYADHLHVQEYQAPKTISEDVAQKRLRELVRVAGEVFAVPREKIAIKTRMKRGRLEQYGRQDERGHAMTVSEGGLKFEVNLFDFLDTGLFLDHRPLRAKVRELARGKRFVNLFCYTGAVTVYACAGGAASTASVDLSNTYLDWAERNLALNVLGSSKDRLVQSDAMEWIERDLGEYDLIYVDPPTFSNSKRAEDFDVQRDHVRLLRACAARLAPDGLILFSNNNRRFKLDRDALSGLEMREITPATIPFDFARDPKIHHCFEIRHRRAD